ncbi:MAG TPA: hypothetical protein ENK57_14260, partial [Polyangiaceae bacterium]|nr:hypothetical protein [Polyangiaceae bacterium]
MSRERPSDAPPPIAQVAVAVWLVITALAVAQAAVQYRPHTWIERDARFYTNTNITLVERGSLVQDEFCASWYEGQLGWNHNLDASWSNIALGRGGEHLPKHPILMPILATPLFWAFGIPGTLIFNLVFFGLAGAGAFLFTRRYGSRTGAMVAAVGLMLATGIRGHAYGYHVDTLILAMFALAMALSVARRGWLAGALVGAAVMLRPTALLWLPSLLLLIADRRDWTTMKRALVSGTAMLVVVALSNWWLYGAPWWSGYNRVLVVVAGVPQLADHNQAFSVPLEDGLRALWGGPYGVSHRLTFLIFVLPGLVLLARRRPLVALAAVLGLIASVVLFAKYVWYGDRFLWPSALFLLPALAATFDWAADRARRLLGWRVPVIAALGTSAMLAAHIASSAIHSGGLTETLPTLTTNTL